MNSAKFLASAGALLLATSALTSTASAQVVYNGQVVTSTTPQVSTTYAGHTTYAPGSTTQGYQKGGQTEGYVIATQPAPVPQVTYAPEPVYVETVQEPIYVEEPAKVVIEKTPAFTAPTKANAIRLSLGYGYASAGDFQYGIGGSYTSASADSADWTAPTAAITDEAWINEDLKHSGLNGSLRADVGNFFIDGMGGVYSLTGHEVSTTYNVAEAIDDQGAIFAIGPSFWAVDESGTLWGGLGGTTDDSINGAADDFDKLTVTATIDSTITDIGGVAGYSFNLSNLPVKLGLGLAGRSLSRVTDVDVTASYDDVTAGESGIIVTGVHKYSEDVSGMYFGPAMRLNYDPHLTKKVGAHFGGSLQALYGNSSMTATQVNGGTTYKAEEEATGMMIAGEIDAGLSFQVAPSMKLGLGVFAGMSSGAPAVAAATAFTGVATADEGPTLTSGTWTNYGLKGSMSASF